MITKIMFFGILCVSILCVSNVSYSHKSEFISKESQESQESQKSHESKDIVSKPSLEILDLICLDTVMFYLIEARNLIAFN